MLEDLTTIHNAEMRLDKDQGSGSRLRPDGNTHLLIKLGDRMLVKKAQTGPA